ncbi:MAG: GNAT family N-acetyltransferase, partial [Gemmatimonadales bacterium]
MALIRFASSEKDLREAVEAHFKEMGRYDFAPEMSEAPLYVEHALEGARSKDPVLVVEEDGRIVGLTLWTNAVTSPSRTGDLMTLGTWIAPSHRRTGLGSRLRAAAEDIARRRGYLRLVGSVHPDNMPGVESLKGRGWKTRAHIVV